MALKRTSSTVAIGFTATEAVAGTMAQISVDLNLSPLDNEVFVVEAINLEPDMPDALPGTNTRVAMSMTSTSQTALATLANSNCLATAGNFFRGGGLTDSGVAFQQGQSENPATTLAQIGIIATSDFFIQVEGDNNLGVRGGVGKVYGYRARADASTYAALVQSEVLSA
jgi:hypothetical protein